MEKRYLIWLITKSSQDRNLAAIYLSFCSCCHHLYSRAGLWADYALFFLVKKGQIGQVSYISYKKKRCSQNDKNEVRTHEPFGNRLVGDRINHSPTLPVAVIKICWKSACRSMYIGTIDGGTQVNKPHLVHFHAKKKMRTAGLEPARLQDISLTGITIFLRLHTEYCWNLD